MTIENAPEWIAESCTLPTYEQPLRTEEFDELFRHDVIGVEQTMAGTISLALRTDPDVASRAASLAVRETACCSFFGFELSVASGATTLHVSTDEAHVGVLTAVAERVRSLIAVSS